jgi:hypothetical protein
MRTEDDVRNTGIVDAQLGMDTPKPDDGRQWWQRNDCSLALAKALIGIYV